MTTSTYSEREIVARTIKANRLADAFTRHIRAIEPNADDALLVEAAKLLDEAAWTSLAKAHRIHPPSHVTVAAIIALLESRADDLLQGL